MVPEMVAPAVSMYERFVNIQLFNSRNGCSASAVGTYSCLILEMVAICFIRPSVTTVRSFK